MCTAYTSSYPLSIVRYSDVVIFVNKAEFKYLFSYIKPYRKLIVQLLLGFLTGSLLSLLLPFLTQAIVDVGITTNNLDFVVLVLIAQLVLTISQTVVGFIRSWIMLHVSIRIGISLISDFLIKLMKLPIRFFDTKMIGDLRQRIDDNNRIQSFLTGNLISMSFGVFMFVIYSFIMAYYDWHILLIFYAGSILYIVWILLFLKRRKELDYKRFFSFSGQSKQRLPVDYRHAGNKVEQLRKTKTLGMGKNSG